MKRVNFLFAAILFAVVFSSCEKEKHTVTFYNNFWTDATVTVNGETKTMPEEGSASFEVEVDMNIDYSISTKGGYGLTISWNADANNPIVMGSEDQEYDVNVPSDYFFLAISHNKPNKPDIDNLKVNYGNATEETNETVSLAYTTDYHMVGYYKAISGCKIRVQAGATADYWMDGSVTEWGFNFPNQENQAIGLYTEDLDLLKKKARVVNASLPAVVSAQ